MKPATVVIKKYGNRRLYDTAGSRYVNLDDIARFVREGKELQVVDAKTGQDLTRVTLTQVIMEDAKDKPTGLPLELLVSSWLPRMRFGRSSSCGTWIRL